MYPDKTVSVPFEGNIHLSGGEESTGGSTGEVGGQSLSYIWNGTKDISDGMSF